jgi:hypothetical protein
LVPGSAPPHSIHHRLSRSVKHVSVVACISASGGCLTPYVVTSQNSAAVSPGCGGGRDSNWIAFDLRNVFLPHLMIIRIVKDLREEDAVLLMDNCSPHITPGVIELLSTARGCRHFRTAAAYHANLPSSRSDSV